MDSIKRRVELLSMNKYPGVPSEDIHEHLHTLYRYTRECDSVFETGVRGVVSSWVFLYGLLDGKKVKTKNVFL